MIEFVFEKVVEKGFWLSIEETKSLGEPYVCMVNHLGKKLYFRKGEKLKEGTELIPLSKSELKEVGIEETANSELEKLFDIKIEEVV